jgi:hypothetical protein
MWQPPSKREVKCNVDVAIFSELHRFNGCTIVLIRNDRGQFLKTKTMWLESAPKLWEQEH